jgi:hypothetical protein
LEGALLGYEQDAGKVFSLTSWEWIINITLNAK